MQTTLLRASNIAFSSRRDFYSDMRERMPDPREVEGAYRRDPQAEEVSWLALSLRCSRRTAPAPPPCRHPIDAVCFDARRR